MTWGRDTDEHEARDQLIAFAEAGGTLRRHRGRLRRRRQRGADRHAASATSSRRDEVVLATKAGISPAYGRARHRHLARPPADHPRRLAEAARGRPRRPVAGPRVDRRDPGRGDALRARPRGHLRPASVRRHLQLHRLADRAGRDLAAGRPGPAPLASTQVEYSLLNRHVEHEVRPGRRRRSASASCRGRPWAAACSPASTAPARRPTRAPPPSTSPGSSAPTSTSAAAGSSRPSRAPPTVSAGRRSRSRSCGSATGPGVTAPIVGARTAAQLDGALGIEELTLPAEIVDALDDVSAD